MVIRFHSKNLFKILFACILTLVCSHSIVYGVEVNAQLDRESVAAGNAAILSIQITGGRAEQPTIPAVENLIVQPRGKSQQMQIVNGRTSISMTYNFAVGSNTPGIYQIPSFDVFVSGKKHPTRALNLQVLDSAAAQPPAGMPPNPSSDSSDDENAADRFGFLTVELADTQRNYVYVGEIAPVRIRAWLPQDSRASLRSGIQPEGNAFTLHNVSSEPVQTHEVRNGKPYLVVTWYGGISATKAGKYPASLSVDATVAVPDKTPRTPKNRNRGPFSDPFFNSFFDQMNVQMIQKDVTLQSVDQEIEVRPLPQAGRPKNFSGAVGNFTIETWSAPNQWQTGEPQKIQARLSGSGNFALLQAPELTPQNAWKTYPAKSNFSPSDNASFSGSKSFEFNAVPRKGGSQALTLEFNFFDPQTATYRIFTTQPKGIQVAGKDITDEKPAPKIKQPLPQPKKPEGLIKQHAQLTKPSTLTPLVSRPLFLYLLGVSFILTISGGAIGSIRKRLSDPQRRAHLANQKSIHEALSTAARCIAQKNALGYFDATRLALQHRLSAIWNQPAQAITLAEITARMPSDTPVAHFFLLADRQSYSPPSSGEVLPEWQDLFQLAMKSLTSSAD